jgi:hypothetical protein
VSDVAARLWSIALVLAAAFAGARDARAQIDLVVATGDLDGAAVLKALERECYEAGLSIESSTDAIMDCSAIIEERVIGSADEDSPAGADRIVVRHKLRFTLLERAGGGRVGVEAWTETEELGTVIEQPVTSEDYKQRVERVVQAVVARLRSSAAPAWAGRYDSEQAWHLDAHVRAVSHCDANLARMSAESVAADLAALGLRPIGDETRDRCEQLYTHLFEWALSRGNAAPTLAEYLRYRAALPAEQRVCSGQLALEASCPL